MFSTLFDIFRAAPIFRPLLGGSAKSGDPTIRYMFLFITLGVIPVIFIRTPGLQNTYQEADLEILKYFVNMYF